jgi:hypothetical protein
MALVPSGGDSHRYDAAAVGFRGGEPNWPGTDTLTSDTFKVTVASWRRLNPGSTPTHDFVCDVGSYAPKQPFVQRVALVDAHVPAVQRLIEPLWDRVYFTQGLRTSPSWRTLQLEWAATPVAAAALAAAAAASGGPPLPGPGFFTGVATVLLPLPVDTVVAATVVRPGVTRLVLASAAPRPVAVMAALAGPLTLVGIPGLPPLTLARDTVVDGTGGPCAIEVLDATLAAAVTAGVSLECAALTAAPLASDADLARVLSLAASVALKTSCGAGAGVAGAGPGCAVQWRVSLQYCGGPQDSFSASYSAASSLGGPGAPPPFLLRFLEGPLASYMGFGGRVLLSEVPVLAPTGRAAPVCGYALVPTGNYLTPEGLAAALGAAASAYTWPSFDLEFGMPGLSAPVTVTVDGGHATLDTLAAVVQGAVFAAFAATGVQPAIAVRVVPGAHCGTAGGASGDCGAGGSGSACGGVSAGADVGTPGGPRGLSFTSTASPPYVFTLTLPVGPVAARLGYSSGLTTPAAAAQWPTVGDASHVPCWDMCCGEVPLVPVADVRATVAPSGRLELACQPLNLDGVAVGPTGDSCGLTWRLFPDPASPTYQLGLSLGARVALVSNVPERTQVPCVVIHADWAANTAVVVQEDGTQAFTPWPTGNKGVVLALDTPPLSVYMQGHGGRVSRLAPVPPALFGFQPDTYVAAPWGPGAGPCVPCTPAALLPAPVLVSPGTVRVKDDPYLLLCLAFTAADAPALAGDIYYPVQSPPGGATLVFAPILRSSCDWRPEYDRTFFKAFPGAGIHLGYIRVRVLNADGRPYLTHGHPVSVMLRADVRTDTPSLGGPGHQGAIPEACAGTGTGAGATTMGCVWPAQGSAGGLPYSF